MSEKEPIKGYIVGDKQPPKEEELILDGIRFMREELGIVSDELPTTYAGSKYLYEELMAKLDPPSPRQVALINRLVNEVDGTVSGKLHSRRHAALLIKELKKVRKKTRADTGLDAPWLKPAMSTIAAGILLCFALWPDTTAALFFLIGGVVFVVGGAACLLGLSGMALFILIILVAWVGLGVTISVLFGEYWGVVGLFIPLISLLVFGLYEVYNGRMDWWGNPKNGSPQYDPLHPIQRPPTDRQLNFIDELISERKADDWVLEQDPRTIEEASNIIDYLLTLPYRDSLNEYDD